MFSLIFPLKSHEIWHNEGLNSPNPYPAKVERMINEINYFPERENFQKKKKAVDDWKDLKKKKLLDTSKKTNTDGEKKESSSPSPNKS